MQSPFIVISKVASLTLASTLVLSAATSLGIAKAAQEMPESALPENLVDNDQSLEIAQFTRDILAYDTGEFSVRVFERGGGTFMNVFDNFRRVTILNGAPASLSRVQGQDAYVSFGSFNGRSVEYASQVFAKPQDPAGGFARFFILDQNFGPGGEVSVIRVEDAEFVSVFNVPPGVGVGDGGGGTVQGTLLFFETQTYAVRVFNNANGQRLMNVFNRRTSAQEVNGALASLENPINQFERTVSYVANGGLTNQPLRYYARYDYCSETTFLEIYNNSGARILRENSVGGGQNNIPPADFPSNQPCDGTDPGGGSGVDPRVQDAYVAAVFGGDSTLREVQRFFPDAFMDTSSRQGNFINAGAFSSEEDAIIRVLELRREGFNTRVIFRDVRFR